jgi:hypothetical protein
LSLYARIISERVAEVVDLDPDLHASWVEAGNPKANAYLPLIETPQPAYDPATQALVRTYDVGLTNVVLIWAIRPLTPDEMRKTWTSLEFLGRFESSEMAAIEIARASDQIVQSFYRAALAAQEVVNDDPRTIAGMDYLVSIGILNQFRRDAILG